MRATLVKVDLIGRIAARLPWRERVAQLQSGYGFGEWLVQELKTETAEQAGNPPKCIQPIFDASAAAGPESPRCRRTWVRRRRIRRAAIRWLTEPDAVAEKLIAEIQRVAAREEERDSKQLARWNRKVRAGARLRPLQSFGVVVAARRGHRRAHLLRD